jgi:predicted RNA-binding protein with PIN domain
MHWLIDGYNLMHATGVLDKEVKSHKLFQQRRRRFLSNLADALGAERAAETTVVFDASTQPADMPIVANYQGLSLIFAVGDENADARIEQLIAEHSAPKSLTVVSTDRRVRKAATRRKAKAVTSDDFLDLLDRFRHRESRQRAPQDLPVPPAPAREQSPTSEEADYWLNVFGHLDSTPEIKEALAPEPTLLTDSEIARIQSDIDQES